MINYWKFENQKSFEKNNIGAVILVLLLLSGLLFFLQHQESLAYQREYRAGFEATIERNRNRISEWEQEIETTEDVSIRTGAVRAIREAEERIEWAAEELHAFEALSIPDYLAWFINRLEANTFGTPYTSSGRVPVASLEEMKLIQESGAQPMLPLNYPYLEAEEQFFMEEALEMWRMQNPRFYDYGLYFIWYLIEQNAFYIFLALIIILFGSFLRSERTGKRHSLDFLHTQSVSPLQVMFSKFSVSFLQALLLLVTFTAGTLVLGTLINGLGSLDYPVVRYFPGEGFQPTRSGFTTLRLYLQENFLLMLFGMVFIFSLLQLYNFLFKSEISVIFAGLVTLVGGVLTPIHPYNPFTYLDTGAIVTGRHLFQQYDYAYSVQTGVLLFAGLSIFMIAVSAILMKKTNLR